MGADWQPANERERAMAIALQRQRSADFAALLMGSALYLPELTPGANDERLRQLLAPLGNHVLAYTSSQTLSWVLGDLAPRCFRVDFAKVHQRWPDTGYHLAVNVGTPLAVLLPIDTVTALADGTESLVPYTAQ